MSRVEYRQYNYEQMMHLETHLARWLYKRLAHYWTNAGALSPITLSFAEIRQESGMLERSRANDAVKELEAIFKFLWTSVFSDPLSALKRFVEQGIRSSILFMKPILMRTLLKASKRPTKGNQTARRTFKKLIVGYPVKK